MSENQTSPLAEPDPQSLDELFARDPLELTKADQMLIISEMRKARVRWAQEDSAAKTQGRRAKTSKGIKESNAAAKATEDLAKDLGIDLDSIVSEL